MITWLYRARAAGPRRLAAILVAAMWAGTVATAEEPGWTAPSQLPQTVRVTVPAMVAFSVTNVSVATLASTGATPVSFDLALLGLGRALRISVKADADLTPPSGTAIPASNVSWQTSNVTGGVGVNGVLSKTAYTQVYQGNVGALSGHVDLTWTLSPPGSAIRAGTHQGLLRWKFESVIP